MNDGKIPCIVAAQKLNSKAEHVRWQTFADPGAVLITKDCSFVSVFWTKKDAKCVTGFISIIMTYQAGLC